MVSVNSGDAGQLDAFLLRFRDAATVKADVADYFGEQGVLSLYSDLCQEREYEILQSLDSLHDGHAAERERSSLQNEQNSWKLLDHLYSLRMSKHSKDIPKIYMHTSDFAVVRLASEYDVQLAELIRVKEWLHDIASHFAPAETNNELWSHTRMAHGNDKTKISLDPDAPSRQNWHLHPDDQEYEHAFFATVYRFLRQGQAQSAIDYAYRSCKGWLASTIHGGTYYCNSVSGATEIDEGNVNRRLWKLACRRAARETTLDKYERAVYSLLSGYIEGILPVCDTYEDFLYAHCVGLIEATIERHITSVPRDDFWIETPCAKSAFLVELGVQDTNISGNDSMLNDEDTLMETNTLGIREVFHALSNNDRYDIRVYANEFYHLVQSHIIRNDLVSLVEEVSRKLKTGQNVVHPQELRFFVHLLAFLEDMHEQLPQNAVNHVVQKFVEFLMASKQYTLVASYLSRLPSPAQKSLYARFLSDLPINVTLAIRYQLLDEAAAFGLPTGDITYATVKKTLKLLSTTRIDSIDQIDWSISQCPVKSGNDLTLVRALEWLEWKPDSQDVPGREHLQMTLEHATAIARGFLLQGKLACVAALLTHTKFWTTLPSDIVKSDYHRLFLEHTNYNNLVEAVALYESWSTHDRKRRTFDRRGTIEKAIQAYEDLLTHGWLVDVAADLAMSTRVEDQFRREQVIEIRQLYLPQILLDFQTLLVRTADTMPENLARSIDLANLVTYEDAEPVSEADAPRQVNRRAMYKDMLKYGRTKLIQFVRSANAASMEILKRRDHSGMRE